MKEKWGKNTAPQISTISKNGTADDNATSVQVQDAKVMGFEQALELTKFGKFNYAVICLAASNFTAVLIEVLGIGFVMPVSECDLKLTTQDKGVLSGVGFAGLIIPSLLWGYLADTRGRKKVMKITMLIAFICSAMSSFSNGFWSFFILRFLTGFFLSGSAGPMFAYIGELHNSKYRASAIMYASMIYGVTSLVLPGFALLIINQDWQFPLPLFGYIYKPWRLYIVSSALTTLFCCIACCFLPESPKFVLGEGNQKKAIEILEQINRWNCGKNAEPLKIEALYDETATENKLTGKSKSVFSSVWAQTAPLFMKPHLKTTLLVGAIQFGMYAGSNGMFMWFPIIMNRLATNEIHHPGERIEMCEIMYRARPNITFTSGDIIFSETNCISKLEPSTYEYSIILEGIYMVGFTFNAIFINKLSKFTLLFGVTIIAAISSLLAIYVTLPSLAAVFYMMELIVGLGVSLVNTCVVDLYPTHLRAMAACVLSMFGRTGSVTLTNVLGLLLDYHCETAFQLMAAILFFCAILINFVPNIRKKPLKK